MRMPTTDDLSEGGTREVVREMMLGVTEEAQSALPLKGKEAGRSCVPGPNIKPVTKEQAAVSFAMDLSVMHSVLTDNGCRVGREV